MRALKKLICLGLLALAGGCVPSLNPLYTEQDLVFDPALVGVWGDDNKMAGSKESWAFTKAGEKEYRAVYTDNDGNPGEFVAHLAKIEGRLFLDLYPEAPDLKENDFYKMHLIPVHTFLLVSQIGPTLKMAVMDPDWMKKYLEEHPDALPHQLRDKAVILTASTEELQAFVLAHLKDEDMFGKPSDIPRKP